MARRADLGLEAASAAVIRRCAPIVFAAYAAVLFLVTDDFRVGLAHYAPAALFLFSMFIAAARRAGPAGRRILLGATGLAVTFAGSLCQALGIAIHPVHFDHNAVFHVVGMIGLALLCLGAQASLRSGDRQPPGVPKDVPSLAS